MIWASHTHTHTRARACTEEQLAAHPKLRFSVLVAGLPARPLDKELMVSLMIGRQ